MNIANELKKIKANMDNSDGWMIWEYNYDDKPKYWVLFVGNDQMEISKERAVALQEKYGLPFMVEMQNFDNI